MKVKAQRFSASPLYEDDRRLFDRNYSTTTRETIVLYKMTSIATRISVVWVDEGAKVVHSRVSWVGS